MRHYEHSVCYRAVVLFPYVEGISKTEHERLRELRGELNKAVEAQPSLLGTPALRRFASDATLCRYLRARSWKVKKAAKMLKASLEWWGRDGGASGAPKAV